MSRWLPLFETSFSNTSEAGKVKGIVYGYVHQLQTLKLDGASLVNKPMGTIARTQRVQRGAKEEFSRSLLRLGPVADAADRLSSVGGPRPKSPMTQQPPVRVDSGGTTAAKEAPSSSSNRPPSDPQSQDSGSLAQPQVEQSLHDTTGIDQLLDCGDGGAESDLDDMLNGYDERAGGEEVAPIAVDAAPAHGRSVDVTAGEPQVPAEHVPSKNATRFMGELASSRLPYVESCRGALDAV